VSARLDEALAALHSARAARSDGPLDLFGPPAELASVTQAIERVTAHAPTEWRRRALQAVRTTAQRLDELTVDDVRPSLPDDVPVYDERALGSVMRAAARAGWIQSTRTYKPSERPEAHSRPMLVWRSHLYTKRSFVVPGTEPTR
jgi:hypothetical protein